jgi:hypothetical protein
LSGKQIPRQLLQHVLYLSSDRARGVGVGLQPETIRCRGGDITPAIGCHYAWQEQTDALLSLRGAIATRQSCSFRCWGLLRRCRSSQ